MEAHALYLEAKFTTLVQGDLTITSYCQHQKTLVDSLRDIGQLVSDSRFVLNKLHGLNERFSNIVTVLSMQAQFLIFTTACSSLLLQEMRTDNASKVAAGTALFSTITGLTTSPLQCNNASCHDDCSNANSFRCDKGCYKGDKGKNGGDRAPDPLRSTPTPQWRWVCFNPWVAPGQGQQWSPMWRSTTDTGVLGPRPSSLPQV